jgi:hypothetical protein
MASTTARTSTRRGRPPSCGGGTCGSTNAHCASLRSDAYRLAAIADLLIVGGHPYPISTRKRLPTQPLKSEWLASDANLAALTDLSGRWIDLVHALRPPNGIILGMDSSDRFAVRVPRSPHMGSAPNHALRLVAKQRRQHQRVAQPGPGVYWCRCNQAARAVSQTVTSSVTETPVSGKAPG